jgi:hypothetical protein
VVGGAWLEIFVPMVRCVRTTDDWADSEKALQIMFALRSDELAGGDVVERP